MRDDAATWSGGLSKEEAAARLTAAGPNLLPRPESRTFFRIVGEVLREPMFALLLGAGGVYLTRIAGAEVARGDLVILAEGDRVPADAIVITAHDLMTDESLLTGESAPVRKSQALDATVEARPGGDDLPYVFSGSLVVRGYGRTVVTATGARSEIGKIGVAITGIEAEPPRLQAETGRLVRRFAIVSLGPTDSDQCRARRSSR